MPEAYRSAMGRREALAEASSEWTVADLLGILWRRRGWIAGTMAGFLALALIYGLVATARYRATAEIEIQKQNSGAFGLEGVTSDKATTEAADSFEQNVNLQTEMGILQSDAIALEVIRRTGLEDSADYFAPQASRFAWARKLSFGRKPLEPLSVPLTEAPNRRYVALKIFARRRKIAVIAGTRLLAVSYTDPDPARAAAVVSALLQSLSDYGFQARSSAAVESASWLQAELTDLKKQTDVLDARAAALDRQSGALGDDDAHNVVLARLDELNAGLSNAESNRIVREAIWRVVESGDPEGISGLGGNAAAGANTQNAFALLQSLRTQESAAKAQLAESANRYGENWPAVAEQRARLETIQRSIREEVGRLGERARNDYEVALQAERSARDAFAQQKELASRLTGSTVALRLARQEAGESRALYASLLGRLQQTGVLEGLHSANFTVVTPPLAPSPDHPSNPSLALLAALAVAAGMTLGTAAAILREITDDSIRSAAELERFVGMPVLGIVPAAAVQPWYQRLLPTGRTELVTLDAAGCDLRAADDPELMDAVHSLRASLVRAGNGRSPQVILFTRAEPGGAAGRQTFGQGAGGQRVDGQGGRGNGAADRRGSSLPLHLASAIAGHGAPVLYVDADLRRLSGAQAGAAQPGLSELLCGDPVPFAAVDAGPPLLSILPAGFRPACPSELIGSRRMADVLDRWRNEFDFVVIEGPSAGCPESRMLVQLADAVLLSAGTPRATRAGVQAALDALSRPLRSDTVLGLILEGVQRKGSSGAAYA